MTRPRIELFAALVFCALFASATHANDSVDTLTQIHESGTLRVATTGDYRPFSYWTDGSRAGIDVDLAVMLANELGVKLLWVDTSWANLTTDLVDHRFDIAMGGISVTAERAAGGRFSTPYLTTGKTILARCAVQQRFVTVDQLNQANVRVIVNPGGTNEQFVREHLPHANVIVHPDNQTIFAALAAGTADAMITDAIEARLEAAAHHELCLPTDALFAQIEKAYLMPADGAWQAWVDAWLERVRADGRLDAITRRYVSTPSQP